MKDNVYVVGFGDIPEWLKNKIALNKAVIIYEPNEAVENVIKAISIPDEKKIALYGDCIMMTGDELKVIPAVKAKKYKIMTGGERNVFSEKDFCAW